MSHFHPTILERIGETLDGDVAAGKIPGAVVLVSRAGHLAYERVSGYRDRPSRAKVELDTIFRAASMTKPIVSVAALMLMEEGRLALWDPVSTYLPEFANLKVGVERTDEAGKRILELEPCAKPMTIQDLLRHTSGLTYAPFGATHVHAQYRAAGVGNLAETNETLVTKLAALPLLYQPGTTFEYGMSTDVLGRAVEAISGQTLDVFLEERILRPLGMVDTTFRLPPEKRDRFAQPLLIPGGANPLDIVYDLDGPPPRYLAGGAGLLTTAHDYLRFASMLLGRGTFDGVRLLSRKTVALMTSDHLPPGCAYGPFTRHLGITAPLPEYGQGFGLGVNVRTHAGCNPNAGSIGDFSWSGLSGTYFWIDPSEELIVVLMLQAPELRVHYRALLRDLTYAALA
jgi:CubicO group peptidase (beta-lactamase class C family)